MATRTECGRCSCLHDGSIGMFESGECSCHRIGGAFISAMPHDFEPVEVEEPGEDPAPAGGLTKLSSDGDLPTRSRGMTQNQAQPANWDRHRHKASLARLKPGSPVVVDTASGKPEQADFFGLLADDANGSVWDSDLSGCAAVRLRGEKRLRLYHFSRVSRPPKVKS